MTKINTGSRIGGKVACGVVDPATMDALPLLAIDNEDGTSTLKLSVSAETPSGKFLRDDGTWQTAGGEGGENEPTADEKAALAGTDGTPDDTNRYVTDSDDRLTDAREPTSHAHAADDITSGTLDADLLPAMSTTDAGAVPATGEPSGKFLKDDGTWAEVETGPDPITFEETSYADFAAGTLTNTIALESGELTLAPEDISIPIFDGISSKIIISNEAAITGTGAFTVEGWIKPSTVEGSRTVYFQTDGSNELYIYLAAGRLYGGVSDNNTYSSFVQSNELTPDVWVHFAYTRDASGYIRCYIDGSLVSTSATTVGINVDLQTDEGHDVNLGTREETYYFTGNMHGIRNWTVCRTASEINDNKNGANLWGDEDGMLGWWELNDGESPVLDWCSNGDSHNGTLTDVTWTTGSVSGAEMYPSTGNRVSGAIPLDAVETFSTARVEIDKTEPVDAEVIVYISKDNLNWFLVDEEIGVHLWSMGTRLVSENLYIKEVLSSENSYVTPSLQAIRVIFEVPVNIVASIAHVGNTFSQVGYAGFFGTTPIVQPSGDIVTALGDLGLVATPSIDFPVETVTDLAVEVPSGQFLRDDGTWATVDIPIQSAADLATENPVGYYLRDDGTFADLPAIGLGDPFIVEETSQADFAAGTLVDTTATGTNDLRLATKTYYSMQVTSGDAGVLSTSYFRTDGPRTYEAVIKLTQMPNGGDIAGIMTPDRSNWLGVDSSGHLVFNVWKQNSNDVKYTSDDAVIEVGIWYHVAVTYSGYTSTSPKLYVNGVEVEGTTTGDWTQPMATSGTLLAIGRCDNTNGGIVGYIDEARFWDDVRTPQEIADNMYYVASDSANLKGMWTFDEGTGSTFLDSCAGAQHLSKYNVPAYSTTVSANFFLRNGSRVSPAHDVSDVGMFVGATLTYTATVPENSTLVISVSKNGTNWVVATDNSPITLWSDNQVLADEEIYFKAEFTKSASDAVPILSDIQAVFQTNNITAVDMIVLEDFAHQGSNVGFYDATPVAQPTGDVLDALSTLGLVTSPSYDVSDLAAGSPTGQFLKDDGTWDNVPVETIADLAAVAPEDKFLRDDGTWAVVDVSLSDPITVEETSEEDFTAGSLTDVEALVTDELALTSSEVAGPDNTYSATFNGSSSKVEFPTASAITGSGPFTIEFWLKPTDHTSYYCPFCEMYSGSKFIRIVGFNSEDYGMSVYGDEGNNSTAGVNCPDGQWTHCAFTRDANGYLRHYKNGAYVGISENHPTLTLPSMSSCHIGYNEGEWYYKGGMDDVRLWNVCRSDAEILANYDNKLVGNESGLIANWQLNDNSSTANDAGPNNYDGTPTNLTWSTDTPYGRVEEYSATGDRVSPAYDLDAVGLFVSGTVEIDKTTPTDTTATVYISKNGSSWTEVIDGASVALWSAGASLVGEHLYIKEALATSDVSVTSSVQAVRVIFVTQNIAASDVTVGNKLAHTGTLLGFFGETPVVREELTTGAEADITSTAPETADYAIQDLTNSSGYGFATKDEGNTVLAVIANLQARVTQLEDILIAYGLTVVPEGPM